MITPKKQGYKNLVLNTENSEHGHVYGEMEWWWWKVRAKVGSTVKPVKGDGSDGTS
jgi:hypothetical protein